jgi:hypothetical protein
LLVVKSEPVLIRVHPKIQLACHFSYAGIAAYVLAGFIVGVLYAESGEWYTRLTAGIVICIQSIQSFGYVDNQRIGGPFNTWPAIVATWLIFFGAIRLMSIFEDEEFEKNKPLYTEPVQSKLQETRIQL